VSIPLPSTTRPSSRSGERFDADTLTDQLRSRFLNDLHTGALNPGDRLPSIRQVSRDFAIDHRVVAEVYRALEAERLVEVRGRSGVYLKAESVGRAAAKSDRAGVSEWVAALLADAWRRNLRADDLRRIFEACTVESTLRCTCVESNTDQMSAYCSELRALSGIETVPAFLRASGKARGGPVADAEAREKILTADLVLTTHYHASVVRKVIGDAQIPIVVLQLNRDMIASFRRLIAARQLTVIASSGEFVDRLRMMYDDVDGVRERIRYVHVDDAEGIAGLAAGEALLVTEAARRLRPDLTDRHLGFTHSTGIAPETLEELSATIVRLSLNRLPALPRMA
jgi:DNA-binding transcriptional regulator YhcF (GntR family)